MGCVSGSGFGGSEVGAGVSGIAGFMAAILRRGASVVALATLRVRICIAAVRGRAPVVARDVVFLPEIGLFLLLAGHRRRDAGLRRVFHFGGPQSFGGC